MNNILGERAKELRLQLGMTQADVVNELKRSHNITIRQNHVSNIESGAKYPSLPLLAALAQVYETSVDYLLGVTENPMATRDLEYEARTSGVSGRIGQLMARMSDRSRNDLLAIAELLVQREMMNTVLRKVGELGGDAALHEMIDILESSWPGSSRWFFGDDSGLLPPPPDKPLQ